ncbi:hypothetical protein [Alteromonas sp. 14N.309.X.WAT.G.H12]|uniref:hypothetical protein n=1 Tax=Alteromonas sp. 14N.309.X.WAT.G.H12 TaxID=3120824 RepID=UPI002FCEA285
MELTTAQLVEMTNNLQRAKRESHATLPKESVFAFSVAVLKIENGLAKQDTAAFPLIAELVALSYADKALVALSACVSANKHNSVIKAYQSMISEKSLQPIVAFSDRALAQAQKRGDPFLVQCNIAEVKAAHKLCEALRGKKGDFTTRKNNVLSALAALHEVDDIDGRVGGTIDTMFRSSLAGIGHVLAAMASSRTNYVVNNLFARKGSDAEERQFIESHLSPEIITLFEQVTTGEGEQSSTTPVIKHIEAELHQLRKAMLSSLVHMMGKKQCCSKDITLGDVSIERDESGNALSQLPIQIKGRKYDLLISVFLREWALTESIMFIPFQMQLLPEGEG